MVLYTAKPLLSLPMLLSLDPFALLFSMWYMHSMLRGHVSVCVCVCACIFLYRMCFSLTAWRWAPPPPSPRLACCPPRAQRWNEKAVVLPCSWLLVCVLGFVSFFFFFPREWCSLLVVSLEIVHFRVSALFWLRMRTEPLSPRVFSGEMLSDSRNVFGCSIALYSSSTAQSLTFYSLELFRTLP